MAPERREPSDPDHIEAVAGAVNVGVLQFQIGSLQQSIDRLDKGIEKRLDAVLDSLAKQGDRLGSIEQRLVKHESRLEAVEQFKREQEKRDDTERDKAVDLSQTARIWRVVAVLVVAAIGLLGTVAGVINQLGGT